MYHAGTCEARVTYAKLEELSKALGLSKAEIVRRALKKYLAREKSLTKTMRGLVKPKLTLEKLEEAYWVYRV